MAKKPNAYLQKQDQIRQKHLDVGEEMGMQKMWDYIQIALRDPEIMGKDTLGRKRLEKVYRKCQELANYYHDAFTMDVEADCRQKELDGHLGEIWGEDMCPFFERYPYVKKIGYNKPQNGWVDHE